MSKFGKSQTLHSQKRKILFFLFLFLFVGGVCVLGAMYLRDQRVRTILQQAELGEVQAEAAAGQMYLIGKDGVRKNTVEGLKLTIKAGESGDRTALQTLEDIAAHEGRPVAAAIPLAEQTLGFYYHTGYGVPRDEAETAKWTRKAAEEWGYADSEFLLGVFYIGKANVLPTDYVQAYKWLSLAAAQGQVTAAEMLVAIKPKITPEQVIQAKKLIRSFKPQRPLTQQPNEGAK